MSEVQKQNHNVLNRNRISRNKTAAAQLLSGTWEEKRINFHIDLKQILNIILDTSLQENMWIWSAKQI